MRKMENVAWCLYRGSKPPLKKLRFVFISTVFNVAEIVASRLLVSGSLEFTASQVGGLGCPKNRGDSYFTLKLRLRFVLRICKRVPRKLYFRKLWIKMEKSQS